MRKKTLKAAAVATLAATVLEGGCFGEGFWGKLLVDAGITAGYDFLLDNDGIFDLWEDDGNNVAAQ